MRLEGWGGPWFETRSFGALLTMRPIEAADETHPFSAVSTSFTQYDVPNGMTSSLKLYFG
jgi:hypothetical protein